MESLADLLERNSGDPRVRLELGQKLLAYFAIQPLPSNSKTLNEFVDTLVAWLGGSNYKVALLALEVLEVSLGVGGEVLAPYLLDHAAVLMERLGDRQEPVRQAAQDLILKFMSLQHAPPQAVMERMMGGFAHKQWLVRLGIMRVVQEVLRDFGPQAIALNKLTPLVAKLLSDPQAAVRDTASDTLVEMYLCVGDRLAQDLHKKRLLPDNKAGAVFARFEDAKRQGLIGADGAPLRERTDGAPPTAVFKAPPTASASSSSHSLRKSVDEDSGNRRASSMGPKKTAMPPPRTGGSTAGAVTEEQVIASFDDILTVHIFSSKELVAALGEIRTVLEDAKNAEWDKRVAALKRLKALVALATGNPDYEPALLGELRTLDAALATSAKDLRSQVCREAAFTIAYLSERLGLQLEYVAERVFGVLLAGIQNSAKVMASACGLGLKFLLKNVMSRKLLPLLLEQARVKSKEIRLAVIEHSGQILSSWPPSLLEKSLPALADVVKAGIGDSDPLCRTAAREAYKLLEEAFPAAAADVHGALDAKQQRSLGGALSAASSANSLASAGHRGGSSLRPPLGRRPLGLRSTSEIDTGAARRAAVGRLGRPPAPAYTPGRSVQSSGYGQQNSLQRPARLNMSMTGTPRLSVTESRASPIRSSRSMVSHSQPGSRSGSPTGHHGVKRYSGARSGVPLGRTSNNASRDASPSRTPNRFGADRRLSSDGGRNGGFTPQAMIDALARNKGSGGRGRLSEDFTDLGSPSLNGALPEVSEALRMCASANFTDKKTGLEALHQLFRDDYNFTDRELEKITSAFTRMFVDPHNKLGAPFLDALSDFVSTYRAAPKLAEWLYVLTTRLLFKTGSENLSSMRKKISRCLQIVRSSFDPRLQLEVLQKFILDPAQTPSLKVKAELMLHMRDVIGLLPSSELQETEVFLKSLTRILDWTHDVKSPDVRKTSIAVVNALFKLNAGVVVGALEALPKQYGVHCYTLLNAAHNTPQQNRSNRSSLSPGAEASSLDVQGDISSTAAEIAAFCGGSGLSAQSDPRGKGGSQDSGIVEPEPLSALMGGLTLGAPPLDEGAQEELLNEIMQEISNHDERGPERVAAMERLRKMTRDGRFTLWEDRDNFKGIVLVLLETLADSSWEVRAAALKCIQEICQRHAHRFAECAELTMLKVLNMNREPEKEMGPVFERCCDALATHLPPAVSFRVINPVVREAAPSLNVALKMMTKVITEQLTADEASALLGELLPGVIAAYDKSEQSNVRKASVLVLVALINLVGADQVDPFLQSLTAPKIKLLNLYVRKAQTGSNGGVSVK